MANTTPEHPMVHPLINDALTSLVAADVQLFGDPGLALFGGVGSSSAAAHQSTTELNSLYHGRHRAAE